MKILVKYKDLKLLIDKDCSETMLFDNLKKIYELFELEKAMLFDTPKIGLSQFDVREEKRKALKAELEDFKRHSDAIGCPFDMRDAELYALDRKIRYEVLELHGNILNENAAKEVKKESHLHLRIDADKKAAYVKQAQREKSKLSKWVMSKLDSCLDSDLQAKLKDEK